MASKLSIYIAIFLYVLSLCIPAVEDTLGITVIFTAILGHILLIGIPFTFPAWANLSFYFAVKYYFKGLKQNDPNQYEIGFALAIVITLPLMCIGVLMKYDELNMGSIFWLISGFFLVLAFVLQKLKKRTANICLSLIILLFVPASIQQYVKEKDISKYQKLLYPGTHHYLFQEKETDIQVPRLVQVKQNHETRLKATGQRELPIDRNAIDLAVLQGERIEIDFDELVYPTFTKNQKTNCQLQPNQQYILHYPKQYWEDGYEWTHPFYIRDLALAVAKPNQATVVYRAKRLDERHTLVQLIRKSDQKVLYEQKLAAVSEGKECTYAPYLYADELEAGFKLLFDDLPSFEVRYAKEKSRPEYQEILTADCTWQKEKHNQYYFEKKKIKFMSSKIIEPQLLCSKHYVAVGYMTRTGNKYTPTGEFGLHIFHRDDLEAISCTKHDFDLTPAQQQAYKKGEFKLKHLSLMKLSKPKFCREVEALFSDGTHQLN